MYSLELGKYKLNNLGQINIILGKNGSGKSALLKQVETQLNNQKLYGAVKYITPERGGKLKYNPNVENNIHGSQTWMSDSRRKNQFDNFREQSISQFMSLELMFLRELESDTELRENHAHNFDAYFNQINSLLDNIEIIRQKKDIKIIKKGCPSEEIQPENISSGEAELISLAIECLVFQQECIDGKNNFLLLDEPDVHLHPDLQARLCNFLLQIVKKNNAFIIMVTHSTALLGALEASEKTHICFMLAQQADLTFTSISEEYRRILPIFGAHPLSNLYNQSPVFLVEGDDEERIWQQTIRSSKKPIRLYPCSTDGVGNMNKYEKDVNTIINSVYDNAKAYSLRDCDDCEQPDLNNHEHVIRFRLSCRTSENLILSNEVLNTLGITWNDLKSKIDYWLSNNHEHKHFHQVKAFKDNGFDRKSGGIKDIRNDLMHMAGSSMSWEVAVGKSLGKIIGEGAINDEDDNSIFKYLGADLTELLKGFTTQ
jgi:ABC-type lipoprotein export system ATPase subunit